MKFALVLLALLPLIYGASIDEKGFIDELLGEYDILDLAKQIVTQYGIDEIETQCEANFCPQVMDPVDDHNALITSLCCGVICKEAKVLASQYLTTTMPLPMPPSK